MKKFIYLVVTCILILSFSGCGSASTSSGSNSAEATNSITKDMAPGVASATSSENANDKKIVYTCYISIAADNVKDTQNKIDAKATELKGYITNETLMDSNGDSTIRVPMENYEEFLKYIDKNCTINNKKQESTDVTEAYVDNDARLTNLKLQESQLQDLMKKANTIDEILKVQDSISKVRGDIESLSGKKKLWDNEVNYSTVNIAIAKNESTIKNKELSIIGISELGNSVGKGFISSTKTIIVVVENILIFLLSNIFYLIIFGGLGLLAYRYYKKHKKG